MRAAGGAMGDAMGGVTGDAMGGVMGGVMSDVMGGAMGGVMGGVKRREDIRLPGRTRRGGTAGAGLGAAERRAPDSAPADGRGRSGRSGRRLTTGDAGLQARGHAFRI